MVWHYLQYMLALRSIGIDVYYYERASWWKEPFSLDHGLSEYNPRFVSDLMDRHGFSNKWSVRLDRITGMEDYYHGFETSYGLSVPQMKSVFKSSDCILNISGSIDIRQVHSYGSRVFIDTDPYKTQVQMAKDPEEYERVKHHDGHFTFAQNIGNPDCLIPATGLSWKVTRQPIYFPAVQRSRPHSGKPSRSLIFSTIMSWRSYEDILFDKHRYRSNKGAEVLRMRNLSVPRGSVIRLAIGDLREHSDIVKRIRKERWEILDGGTVSHDEYSYLDFICKSDAEFSPAKNIYARSRSGWLGDRSPMYLANGKPLVIQDTGLERLVPLGKGILTFSNESQATDAIRNICSDYRKHATVAYALARELFDGQSIVRSLI